jgi:hypothetical protein
MRHPLGILAVMMALGAALGGCESAGSTLEKLSDTMTDLSPFGVAKKPLPGERKSVFPEGVPGVQQGMPPELVRGSPATADTQPVTTPAPSSTRQALAPAAAESKPKPKRTPPPKAQARPRTPPTQEDPREDSVWPPPPPASQTAPWPAPAQQSDPPPWPEPARPQPAR